MDSTRIYYISNLLNYNGGHRHVNGIAYLSFPFPLFGYGRPLVQLRHIQQESVQSHAGSQLCFIRQAVLMHHAICRGRHFNSKIKVQLSL